MNYFSEIIENKYPDIDATIQIKQDGLKVTMIVETPKGKREIIEKTLTEFGLVITHKKSPEEVYKGYEFLILGLINQLNLANAQIENKKHMLDSQKMEMDKQDNRIDKLEKIIGDALLKKTDNIPPIVVCGGDKIDIDAGKNANLAKGHGKVST